MINFYPLMLTLASRLKLQTRCGIFAFEEICVDKITLCFAVCHLSKLQIM